MSGIGRRELLKGAAAAAGWLLAPAARALAAGAGGIASGRRPNFVFFLIDDLGWADVGCYGSTYYETPHIDRLAAQGMRFTDAYAACAVCSPTRASILTGKYPARLHITRAIPIEGHRIRGGVPLVPPRYVKNLPLEDVTIAEVLKEAGYATAHIGKWHCCWEKEFFPEHQGFDLNVGGNGMGNPGNHFYPYNGSWKMHPETPVVRWNTLPDGKPGEYLTDRLTDEAEKFIDACAKRQQPFFLYFPHYAVHSPIQAKSELVDRYRRKKPAGGHRSPVYAAMVHSVDESVGRVMRELRELKLDGNTIVVFYSDNGGVSRSGVTSNAPLRGGQGRVLRGRHPRAADRPLAGRGRGRQHLPSARHQHGLLPDDAGDGRPAPAARAAPRRPEPRATSPAGGRREAGGDLLALPALQRSPGRWRPQTRDPPVQRRAGRQLQAHRVPRGRALRAVRPRRRHRGEERPVEEAARQGGRAEENAGRLAEVRGRADARAERGAPNRREGRKVNVYELLGPMLWAAGALSVLAAASLADEAPAAPTGLAAKAGSASHVELSWQDSSAGQARFRVQRREATRGPARDWTDLAVVPAGCTRYQSVGLTARRRYVHRIRAQGAAGNSAWVVGDPVQTPAPPRGLRARPMIARPGAFERNGEGDFLDLRSGELIYVFGRWPGKRDHSAGAQIGVIRSVDDGKTWADPETLFQEVGHDLYHASLVRMANGEIGLTYTKRRSPPVLKGEKVFRFSADEGKTWSDEVVITDGGWKYYQTSACDRLVRLGSGRLVHPISRMLDPETPDRIVVNLVYASDDNGRTWRRKTPEYLAEPGGNLFHEASIVEHSPRKLLLLARTRTGRLWESRSDDNGERWSKPAASTVGAPVAPPLVINVPAGREILLIWNPTPSTELSPRNILASQLSADGGRTWHGYRQIEYVTRGAISYASAHWVGDALHLSYLEFGAWQPRYLKLTKAWLVGARAGAGP